MAVDDGAARERSTEVVGLSQDHDGVDVALASGETVRARYAVGADGGRSLVRREAGIGFVGPDATRSTLIAAVRVTEELPAAGKVDERGVHGLHDMGDGTVRVVVTEAELGPTTETTLKDLRRELREAVG